MFCDTYVLTIEIVPCAIEIGTHAASPPLPCAPTYTGSGPMFDTSHLSQNCMIV